VAPSRRAVCAKNGLSLWHRSNGLSLWLLQRRVKYSPLERRPSRERPQRLPAEALAVTRVAAAALGRFSHLQPFRHTQERPCAPRSCKPQFVGRGTLGSGHLAHQTAFAEAAGAARSVVRLNALTELGIAVSLRTACYPTATRAQILDEARGGPSVPTWEEAQTFHACLTREGRRLMFATTSIVHPCCVARTADLSAVRGDGGGPVLGAGTSSLDVAGRAG